MTGFAELNLPHKLLQSLTRMQFTTPTPIQTQTIPHVLAGRDILGSAQTGTGKTGAFGIPLMALLMENKDKAMLVLTPTRELATQVMDALVQMIPVADVKTALLIGGESMPKQLHQLKREPRLIVGTPGRINDHLARKSLNLSNVAYLVLDETDRMLDMGFGVQIEKILGFIPKGRQTLMFSATLPQGIIKLSSKYLVNPVRVAVGSTTAPVTKIKQELVTTSEGDKYKHLLAQLEKRNGSVVVFVKTKHGADRLADKLRKADYTADAIHGDLQQRRRDKVIQSYRDEKFRILVATDVAARGLDIPHILCVINYDLPQVPEDYIHRIGRTARAGAEGEAVNLLTPADNAKWKAIQRLIAGDDDTQMPQRKNSNSRGGASRGGRSGGSQSRDNDRARQGKWAGRSSPSSGRSFDRAERPVRGERSDRPERSERSDRPARPARNANAERTEYADRPVRGERSDRSQRTERTERTERTSEQRPPRKWEGSRNNRTSSEGGSRDGAPRRSWGDNRSEGRSSEGRGNYRAEGRSDGRSETRSESRPARRADNKSGFAPKSERTSSRPDKRDDKPKSRSGFTSFHKKSDGAGGAKSNKPASESGLRRKSFAKR